jgi:hypothetical protein
MIYDHIGMLPNRAFNPIGKTMALHGGKGGDAPDAPDYEKLARQEAITQENLLRQQTQANRVNQVGPLGSVTYTQGGGAKFDDAGYNQAMQAYQQALNQYNNAPQQTAAGRPGMGGATFGMGAGSFQPQRGAAPIAPNRANFMRGNPDQWTQTTSLNPQSQKILDQNLLAKQQGYNQLQTALGNINNNNLPLASVNAGETAQDAIMRRVNPQLQQQDEALRTRLYNQGVRPGTQAWDREYNLFDQQRNDAYSQAALAGIDVGNDARQRAITEQGIPLNLINAYQSGNQVQMPQFTNYAQQGAVQAPDLMGAAGNTYSADMSKYNAGQAQDANTMQGLFSLGSMALMMSDRRLKTDIECIGTYESGLPKYKFKYIWGEEATGAMADEVEKMIPEAVGEYAGFKTVNYAMLGA